MKKERHMKFRIPVQGKELLDFYAPLKGGGIIFNPLVGNDHSWENQRRNSVLVIGDQCTLWCQKEAMQLISKDTVDQVRCIRVLSVECFRGQDVYHFI